MSRRIVLRDHLQKLSERSIEIEAENGEVFSIPPPEIWPDSVGDAVGEVEQAKAIMGGDVYERFVAAGGNARVLGSIIADGWEATIPES